MRRTEKRPEDLSWEDIPDPGPEASVRPDQLAEAVSALPGANDRDEERLRKAAACLLLRLSPRQAAHVIGVSVAAARELYERVRREWVALRRQDLEEYVAEELERLSVIERGVLPAASRGEVLAVEKCLRIIDLRMKLYGLQGKLQAEQYIRNAARRLGVDPDDLRREIDAVLKG